MALQLLYQHAKDEESAIYFLQSHSVLRSIPPICPTCNRDLTQIKAGEGKIFRCPTHKTYKVSTRKGTYWEDSNLRTTKIVELLFLWSFKIPINLALPLVNLTKQTIIQWFSKFRDICSYALTSNPYQIGGPGIVVEVDESLLTAKVRNFRNTLADIDLEQKLVFGGVCPQTQEGFLVHIPNKSAATLLSSIQQFIAPGSIIHTGNLPSYDGIVNLPVNPPYQHLVVIRDKSSVQPVSGASTNHVESYWKKCEHRFKYMGGVPNTTFEGHLDEFMWRERYGQIGEPVLNNLLAHLSIWYPLQ